MTEAERGRLISAALKRNRDAGLSVGGRPKAIKDEAEALRLCELCRIGELRIADATEMLGVCRKTFWTFRERHGYLRRDVVFAKYAHASGGGKGGRRRLMPDERALKALREYHARECTITDICEYAGVSYYTAKRWLAEGFRKEEAS